MELFVIQEKCEYSFATYPFSLFQGYTLIKTATVPFLHLMTVCHHALVTMHTATKVPSSYPELCATISIHSPTVV